MAVKAHLEGEKSERQITTGQKCHFIRPKFYFPYDFSNYFYVKPNHLCKFCNFWLNLLISLLLHCVWPRRPKKGEKDRRKWRKGEWNSKGDQKLYTVQKRLGFAIKMFSNFERKINFIIINYHFQPVAILRKAVFQVKRH